jgi:hypothetical protein
MRTTGCRFASRHVAHTSSRYTHVSATGGRAMQQAVTVYATLYPVSVAEVATLPPSV